MDTNIKVVGIVLFLMMPMFLMAQMVVGVLTSEWPGCHDISSDIMREAGFWRSMKDDFSDADGILMVTYESSLHSSSRIGSITSIGNLKQNLRTLKLIHVMMRNNPLTDYTGWCYHVYFYSKEPRDFLKLDYFQTLN